MSKSAEMTLAYEADIKSKEVKALASVNHPIGDIGASISSGSFPTMGMLVVPCSIKTMSEIATGVTSSLLSRAADVVLKEKRRLVLAVRETPLHGGHLRTLTTLSDMGAIVAPIVPAFYNAAEDGGRYRQPLGRPPAGPVRHRYQGGQALGGRPGGGLSEPVGRWRGGPAVTAARDR